MISRIRERHRFYSDEQYDVRGYNDNSVANVWDTHTGKCIFKTPWPINHATLQYPYLVTSSGTDLHVFELDKGQLLRTDHVHMHSPMLASCSKYILAASKQGVKLLELHTGNVVSRWIFSECSYIAVSNKFVAMKVPSCINVYSISDGTLVRLNEGSLDLKFTKDDVLQNYLYDGWYHYKIWNPALIAFAISLGIGRDGDGVWFRRLLYKIE